ncbi:MAG: NrfD/PsrC family molybdoenzyme membrane anchor subunit [Janthinobacterium lividum]
MPEVETRGRWENAKDVLPDKKPFDAPSDRKIDTAETLLQKPFTEGLPKRSTGDKDSGEPAYYDISPLKSPVWTKEVGIYFFLGGLSSSSFSIARLADRLGKGRYRSVTKAGTLIAAAAALPCAPLLIWDLGDRKRFHHMLRVWKPSSPMNLGSWTLTVYTLMGGIAALREFLRVLRKDAPLTGPARIVDETAGIVADAAGIPLGILLAGYTGVLLSTTATPIWSRNSWIGALFSASAVGAGSSAVRLALEVTGQEGKATEALGKLETLARLTETVCHAGFIKQAGPLAKPLTTGEFKSRYLLGAIGAGIILPEVLNRLPVPKAQKRWLSIAAGIVSLMGGYALRSAFVAAGKPSALNPDDARLATGEMGGTH